MKLSYSLIVLVLVLLFACDNAGKVKSDKELANNFYTKHLAPTLSEEREKIVLLSPKGCFDPCYIGYFDRLFPKLKKNDYYIITGKKNSKAIMDYYKIDSSVVKAFASEDLFNKQYFMRNELILLMVKNSSVSSFTAINQENIKN